MTEGQISTCRAHRSSESGPQGFVQRTGTERLHVPDVVGREPAKYRVTRRQAMVDPCRELIDRIVFSFDGEEILNGAAAARKRHLLEERAGDGIDPIGWDVIGEKRRT